MLEEQFFNRDGACSCNNARTRREHSAPCAKLGGWPSWPLGERAAGSHQPPSDRAAPRAAPPRSPTNGSAFSHGVPCVPWPWMRCLILAVEGGPSGKHGELGRGVMPAEPSGQKPALSGANEPFG